MIETGIFGGHGHHGQPQRFYFKTQFWLTCKFSKMIADIVRLEIISGVLIINKSYFIGFLVDQNIAQQ